MIPLRKEGYRRRFQTPGTSVKTTLPLNSRNGSQFDVVARWTLKWWRRHGGLIDEIQMKLRLTKLLLPLMNVSRRLPDNTVNEKEVNQQTIAMTSAVKLLS